MLLCKTSYVEICDIEHLALVGNSLAAWPQNLKNCRRIRHPLRETKPFLRDKIICKSSGAHIGNVQNNLNIGLYKTKNVALFKASDTVLDCGQGAIIDFPTWKTIREMLDIKTAEVKLNVATLLLLAGRAEEELAAGLTEEALPAGSQGGAPNETQPAETVVVEDDEPPSKKQKKEPINPHAWKQEDLPEYPNAIELVSSESSSTYRALQEECEQADVVAYDIQWTPDFDDGTDNPIALLQLAFPITGNIYVLQLPLLKRGVPAEVKRLFQSTSTIVAGFAADQQDVHKFEVTGVPVDESTFKDVQPWCEAEMGENQRVLQGWRVGLKRASNCVLDFEMDKTKTLAASDWERTELTPAQVEYAAMDVWVALRLYQRLAPVYDCKI